MAHLAHPLDPPLSTCMRRIVVYPAMPMLRSNSFHSAPLQEQYVAST
jgi:hypothetical protein